MRIFPRFLLGAAGALLLLFLGAPGVAAQSIGSSLPAAANQQLPNATGSATSLSAATGSAGTVIIFWSNNCPWTGKYENRVLGLADEYEDRGIGFVLVNSNSAADFPEESLAASREQASGFPVPYLKDEGARLAEALGAERTPHVFVYDGNDQLVYAGAIDNSPGDPSAVEQPHLRNALRALTSGGTPPTPTTPAFGCRVRN